MANLGGTSERHFVHVVVGGDGGPGGGTESWDDVDHSGGKASLLDQVGHIEGSERRLLRHLHDHHVSSRQGGAQLPRLHQEGEVPRDDLPAHPHGFVAREAEEVPVDGNGFPVVLISPAGVIPQALEDHVQVHQVGDHVGLAIVQGLQGRQVGPVTLDQIRQAVEQPALSDASMRRHGEPSWKAALAAFTALSTSSLSPSAT